MADPTPLSERPLVTWECDRHGTQVAWSHDPAVPGVELCPFCGRPGREIARYGNARELLAATAPEILGAEDERYVVSDERLAEIRAMLDDDHPGRGVDTFRLAGAVYDLLAERDGPCDTVPPPMTREEALDRALDWAEGRLSHTNTVHADTPERRLEVVAVLDAQEVVKWAALAQALPPDGTSFSPGSMCLGPPYCSCGHRRGESHEGPISG